ncbi:hypothetical protein L1987_03309 [Smallanthus sonchifolius]|uniref:Uncharacterized protein n=1 Tax=Smallanthus sonchifolius TaxID=185202 RepID=A0ACB9KAA2_9ASTR|nr:hypothetical protein L1987_03309 [Smallanthus sonchifolius]
MVASRQVDGDGRESVDGGLGCREDEHSIQGSFPLFRRPAWTSDVGSGEFRRSFTPFSSLTSQDPAKENVSDDSSKGKMEGLSSERTTTTENILQTKAAAEENNIGYIDKQTCNTIVLIHFMTSGLTSAPIFIDSIFKAFAYISICVHIKLSIAGKDTIKEDDFGEWSSNSLVKDYDITSSISGSEDDDNREFGGHSDLHRGLLVSTKRKVFVRLPNGEVVSFRKCLLLGDSEKILFEHDLSGSLKDDDTPFVTVREVIEKLLNVINEPRNNTCLRVMLLAIETSHLLVLETEKGKGKKESIARSVKPNYSDHSNFQFTSSLLTMAETAASALLGVLFEKLTDEALKKFARSQKIHSELKELKTTLRQIEALLNDASRKEITDESVGLWLNSLQHLAYDIDDILDDVATEALQRELNPESEAIASKVRKLIVPTCCTNFSLSHRLSSKLDRITKKLQDLEKQKGDLGLSVKNEKQKDANRGKETSLLESDVVGRQGEKERLINRLLGGSESSKENFSIVPIVGMGGVGKTTLARLLYNDTLVNDQFKLKAWVCVSDDFDVTKISNTILQCLTRENKKFEDLNQLQMALIEQFKDKRFLLVVDDVWTEKYEEWENLVRPFHSGARGSRIIMTTRKEQLLKMLGFDHLDRLESLSDKDALSLLALHALGVDNFDSHPTLRAKGEGVVEKCGHLPLALKAIGRLLRTKTHEEKWDDVLNSKIWDSKSVGDLSADWKAVFPALRLSYHDLSADLKRLFAYCSLFPKDFLFNKEDLVLLWMAEGFLNKTNATKSPESLGLEYFEELLSRSFFQQAPNDGCLFVMHDLMNDLATFVSREFYLRFDNNLVLGKEALAKYRHMSFIREKYVAYPKFEAFMRAKSLRTLLAVHVGEDQTWESFYLSNRILVDLLPELELLRVLSLSSFKISEVPDFIGSLKHLRYLNLSRTSIKELPENVGNLYNLQTLIVSDCEFLTKLPTSFLKLKRLRHFDMENTPGLTKLPLGIGELRSLRTLPKIIIGGVDGLAIDVLKALENLQGKFSIKGLQNVQSRMHAREVNLSQKRLTKLELNWFDDSRRGPLEKEVLTELEPNKDRLKELAIVSYGGTKFSNWVGDSSFHVLVNVSIRGCRKCTSLPPFGQLPSLTKLFIQGMDEVKDIGLELTGSDVVAFRSLKVLSFYDMSAIPSLEVLEIQGCGYGVLRSMVQAASSITKLEIRSISGLRDEVWRGVIVHLRAVEEVSIEECNEIRYLWESEAEASKVLSNLKKLNVWWCNKLVSLGEKEDDEDNLESSLLSSLRTLNVTSCDSMERCCCPNSVSIEILSIRYCSSVTRISFPTAATGRGGIESFLDLQLSNLTRLSIYNCENLESLPELSNLNLLQDLEIKKCPSIDASILGGLWPPKLCSLGIGGLKKPISEWGTLNFPSSLVDLTVYEEPHENNFHQLSDLLPSSLTTLTICSCDNLESLSMGLQHLTSLQHLQIIACPKMKHLPETLLPSLLRLYIYKCPDLEERCNGRGSHYWPLISHIPCIEIDFSFWEETTYVGMGPKQELVTPSIVHQYHYVKKILENSVIAGPWET